MDIERRFIDFDKTGFEIERRKNPSGDNSILLKGYAAIFNQRTELWEGFFEEIKHGFFRKALTEASDIFALFNHNDDFILGERNAGTLRMSETKKGLYYQIEMSDTQRNRDFVVSPIERGELKGSSFGFTISNDGARIEVIDEKKGDMLRVLLPSGAKRLYDVGPVTYPAYTETSVGVAKRSVQEFWEEKKQEEEARRRRKQNKNYLDIQLLAELTAY